MKTFKVLLWAVAVTIFFSGCVATKVATVPMRVVGSIISIVPGVGNTAHDAIDEAAEKIDNIPI